MALINIGHITLNCTDRGDGPAIIFIPGLVGLYDAWSFQLNHFAQQYRCVSFDHRGTGDSDKPTSRGAYSTGAIADDVIALMNTLDIATA
ncbi:MAG: alpha/beta fold hydrolase, partial [Rhodospirillales bacterium]|nr:alpha/beta fold hydrolase [Rhodospirillales bacterium]